MCLCDIYVLSSFFFFPFVVRLILGSKGAAYGVDFRLIISFYNDSFLSVMFYSHLS